MKKTKQSSWADKKHPSGRSFTKAELKQIDRGQKIFNLIVWASQEIENKKETNS